MQRNIKLENVLLVAVRPVPKECWKNSVLALYHMRHLEPDAKAVYVEGWLLLPLENHDLWIEHGWLEVDGALVDVTLDDTEPEHYRRVREYTMDEIDTRMNRARGRRKHSLELPLFMDDMETWREMMAFGNGLMVAALSEA